MHLKIKLFNIIAIAIIVVASAVADNTCQTLISCLQDADNCRRGNEQKMEKRLNQSRTLVIRRLRQRLKLQNCDDSAMDAIVGNLRDHRAKTHRRSELVTRCINGDATSFPGCQAFPLPPETSTTNDCKANIGNDVDKSNGQAGGGGLLAVCKPLKCLKLVCGCQRSKICHECYETSALHDEIHTLTMKQQLMRAKCTSKADFIGPVQHDEVSTPDQDESIMEAWNN